MAKYTVRRASTGDVVQVPTITFLATDVFAMVALDAYEDIVVRLHPSDDYTGQISQLRREFFSWRTQYPSEVKIPD